MPTLTTKGRKGLLLKMGMSASQVRLLSMTARVHDIENEAERIQNQKMLLANQSDEAYEEYLNALEQKNIQAAVFSPETGTFNWEEIGIQGLFDNGYALKINSVPHTITQTTNISSANTALMSGISESTSIHDLYTMTTYNGFIAKCTPPECPEGVTITVEPSDETGITELDESHLTDNATAIHNLINDYGIKNVYIKDAAGFNVYLQYLNSYNTQGWDEDLSDVNFILCESIDVNELEQSLLCDTYTILRGNLYGNGNEIKNVNKPIFYSMENATVKDLKITQTAGVVTSDETMGLLAKKSIGNSTINNCIISNLNMHGADYVSKGGFVGELDGTLTISNSGVTGQMASNSSGGFVGLITTGTLTIDNCYNDIVLNQGYTNAGFVGVIEGNTSLIIDNSITINKIEEIETEGCHASTIAAIDNGGTIKIGEYGACAAGNPKDRAIGDTAYTEVKDLYHFSINIGSITVSGEYASVDEILDAIEDKLGSDDYMAVIHDGKITITGPNAISSATLTEESGFSPSIASKLGFGGFSTTYDTIDIDIPGSGWVVCTNMDQVRDALGANIDPDSPALLRDLIANAMAIICTYDPDVYDENGQHIYTETSVTVDTHLREVQNDADMAKAEANYEAALRKIDQKDKKYDKELAAIENERKAVLNQMETFKNCIKENIDRTFKIFNG